MERSGIGSPGAAGVAAIAAGKGAEPPKTTPPETTPPQTKKVSPYKPTSFVQN